MTADRDRRLDEVLTEYLEKADAGSASSRQELLARHPDLAVELAEFFANQDRFDSLLQPLGTPRPALANGREPSTLDAPGGDRAPTQPSLSGQTFGEYELLAEIARGGMGVVHRARQRLLQREVALKMILAGQLATAEDVQRFRLEAEAAARLDHPHIVPIYDYGEVNGRHYYTMKLIEGSSLSQRLSTDDRPSGRDAARLVATVARAVHYAHQRGILHRDLKPGNILLGPTEVYVTDFGLAKRLVTPEAKGSDLPTPTGTAVGTPSYMAPEQATNPRSASTAADIYSLGAILYELLTGRPPFRAETPMLTLLQVIEGTPPRPSTLCPGLDRDLETICLECLEKDPAQRYASALALAEDLERFLRGEPIQARPVGRLERVQRWCRREPLLAGTLGLLLFVLVGGLGVVAWLWMRAEANFQEGQRHLAAAEHEQKVARREKEEAVRQFEEAERQRKLAEQRFEVAHAVVDEFCVRLSEDRLRRLPGMETLRKELLRGALRHYSEFLRQKGDDSALRAEAASTHYRLGELINSIGHTAEALKEYQQARDLYDQVLEADPGNEQARKARARALHQIAILEGQRTKWVQARASLEKARTELMELSKERPDDRRVKDDLAVVLSNLAGQLLARGQLAEGQTYMQEALTLREALVEQHPENAALRSQLAVTYSIYGNLLLQMGRQTDAARYCRESCAIHEELARTRPSEPAFRYNLAVDLRRVAQFELAEPRGVETALATFQRAQEILDKLATANPLVVSYGNELAAVHRYAGVALVKHGRRPEGRDRLLKAIELLRKVVAAQPDQLEHQNDLAGALFDLGVTHSIDKRWVESASCFEESRDLREKIMQSNPEHVHYRHDLVLTWENLGGVLWNAGRKEEGMDARERGLQHFVECVQAAPQFQSWRRNLVRHCESTGRMQRTTGRLEQSVATVQIRAKLAPTDARELHQCARDICLTAALVGGGKPDLTEPQQKQRQRFGDAAMELLRQAVAAGFRDGDGLQKEPAFAVLGEREEFRKLIAGLMAASP